MSLYETVYIDLTVNSDQEYLYFSPSYKEIRKNCVILLKKEENKSL